MLRHVYILTYWSNVIKFRCLYVAKRKAVPPASFSFSSDLDLLNNRINLCQTDQIMRRITKHIFFLISVNRNMFVILIHVWPVSDEQFVTEAHVPVLFSPIMSWWFNMQVPLLKHTWSTESLLFKLELDSKNINHQNHFLRNRVKPGMHLLCI